MATALKTDCQKFAPNVFNKRKCQHCFKTKEVHSAEALENNRATRNVFKFGYLFVAPDTDFSDYRNRKKRWQRRWFVLYDDGELTYSVDEHPDTVPQGVIDMNKVLEVSDAEYITGNSFSFALKAPERVHFIKGTSREESNWWFDILSNIARSTVHGKIKRFASISGYKPVSQNFQVADNSNGPIHPHFKSFTPKNRTPTTNSQSFIAHTSHPKTSRLNQSSLPLVVSLPETSSVQLQPPSVNQSPQTPSITHLSPQVNTLPAQLPQVENSVTNQSIISTHLQNSLPTGDPSKTKSNDSIQLSHLQITLCNSFPSQLSPLQYSLHSSSPNVSNMSATRTHYDNVITVKPDNPESRSFELMRNLPKDQLNQDQESINLVKPWLQSSSSGTSTSSVDSSQHQSSFIKKSNASWRRSCFQNAGSDFHSQVRGDPDGCGVDSYFSLYHSSHKELMPEEIFKKGWLIQQITENWHKQWAVLTSSSFILYQDPKAEALNIAACKIDVQSMKSVEEVKTVKSHAFTVNTSNGNVYTFSAVTTGICNNWIQTLRHVIKVHATSPLLKSPSGPRPGKLEGINCQQRISTTNCHVPYSAVKKNLKVKLDVSSSDNSSTVDDLFTDQSPPVNQALPVSPPLNRTVVSKLKEKAKLRSSPPKISDKRINFMSSNSGDQILLTGTKDFNMFRKMRNLSKTVADISVLQNGEANFQNKQPLYQELQNGYNLVAVRPNSHFQQQNKVNPDDGFMNIQERSWKESLQSVYGNSSLNNQVISKAAAVDKIDKRSSEQERIFKEEEANSRSPIQEIVVFDDLETSFYLCQDRLFDLKNKLQKTSNIKEELLLVGKDICILCEEIAKISGLHDIKLKDVNEFNELKSVVTDLKNTCEIKDTEVERLNNEVIALKTNLNELEQNLQKAHNEVVKLQKENMCLKDRVKQLEMVLKTSGSDYKDCLKCSRNKRTQMKVLLDEACEARKSFQQRLQTDFECYSYFEMNRHWIEQEICNFQSKHCSHMALIITRINDLTSKLASAERNLNNLKRDIKKERINCFKDCEKRLKVLESKISYIEACVSNGCYYNNNILKDFYVEQENHVSFSRDVLVRLNSLDSRVKVTSNMLGIEAETTKEIREEPEINLQRKSVTPCQERFLCDVINKNINVLSLSSFTKMLLHKVQMITTWTKKTLMFLYKQILTKKEPEDIKVLFLNDLGQLVKTCQCLLPEDVLEIDLVYLLLVLQEVATAAVKLNDFGSLHVNFVILEVVKIKKLLTSIKHEFSKMLTDKDIGCDDILPPTSYASLFSTLNISTWDTLSVSDDNILQTMDSEDEFFKSELLGLQENWKEIRKLLDIERDSKIKILIGFLQNDQLERSNQKRHELEDNCCVENIVLEELLLGEIHQVILCHSGIAKRQIISKLEEHCITALYTEPKAFEIWTTATQSQFALEVENVFALIKNSCVKNTSFLGYEIKPGGKLLNNQSVHCLLELTELCVFTGMLQAATIYCSERLKTLNVKPNSVQKTYSEPLEDTWLENFHSHLRQKANEVVTSSCLFLFPNRKPTYVSDLSNDSFYIVEKLTKINAFNIAKINERYSEKLLTLKLGYQEELVKMHSELEVLKQQQDGYSVGNKEKNTLCSEVVHYQETSTVCQTCITLEQARKGRREELEHIQNQLFIEKEHKKKQLEVSSEEQVENEGRMRSCIKFLQHKDEVLGEETLLQHYQGEFIEYKSFTERSLDIMEKSYNRLLTEVKEKHKLELERLKTEKEQVLDEEIKATEIALAAIKKAHQKELEQEICRCREECLKLEEPERFETLYKDHKDTIAELRKELVSLSERYSMKCLENAVLKEHLETVCCKNDKK